MKTYAFLADGFETVEALAVVDCLRRAGQETVTVSVKDTKEVTSAQKITVVADALFSECDFSDGDAVFLPGGMPGTLNLEAHEGLAQVIDSYYKEGRYVVAICAAPSILGHHGILEGRRATAYPGFEKDLVGATVTGAGVEVDGKVVTARGMGKAVELGLKLVELFVNQPTAAALSDGIQNN